jgi:NTP pyrophosphatase (non-canonical NTP hydrolase)/deoxyadenosine/deoxycytidine kinase
MFNKYQKKAAGTFKQAKPITDPTIVHSLDWSLGLGGEAGEVLDLIKHATFHGEELDRMELAKELGDVLWYVNAICTTMDMSLADVAELNLAKLAHRYNKGYSVKDSANRHSKENAFKDSPIYKVLSSRINKDGHAPVNVIMIGPDGAGKTTLMKHLSQMMGMPIVKCDYRTEDKVETSKANIYSQINVLYDRFYYPDDIVYSKVKGLLYPDYSEIKELLKSHNTVVVYVYASLDELVKRSAAWADDYVATTELQSIIDIYNEMLPEIEAAGIPVFVVCNDCPMNSDEYKRNLAAIEDFVLKYSHLWGGVEDLMEEV